MTRIALHAGGESGIDANGTIWAWERTPDGGCWRATTLQATGDAGPAPAYEEALELLAEAEAEHPERSPLWPAAVELAACVYKGRSAKRRREEELAALERLEEAGA